MIGFFLGTGIMNLLIGYAIAVLILDRAPTPSLSFSLPRWKLPLPKIALPKITIPARLVTLLDRLANLLTRIVALLRRKKSIPAAEEISHEQAALDPEATESPSVEVPPEEKEEAPTPPASPLQDIPKEWLSALAAEGIQAQSFVEASAHVLRLEVGRYREQLLVADSKARACQATGDAAALETLRSDLALINNSWLETQRFAAEQLGGQHGNMRAYEEAGRALEETLLDQAAQIETTESNLQQLDLKHDPNNAAKRICSELARLIDLAHSLRDRMFETFALIMRSEHRLADLPDSFLFDSLTGLANRVGLEKQMEAWFGSDAARLRLVSFVLIDIDRLGKLNERLGPRAGDRILAAIGQQLAGFVRRDRGFDRVIRLEGQKFLLFLGDTGPRQALSAIERIRQSCEAITLVCDGTEVEFTISSGVAELDCNEPAECTITRTKVALKAAQKAGRNRTAIDDGNGPEVITDPPRYTVKARVLEIPKLN